MSVKQQVTDISEALQGLTRELEAARGTIDMLYREVRNQNRQIESLNRLLRKKEKENERLTAIIARLDGPGKNSGNSSTPPSKEGMRDEIVRRTKSLRKPSGKGPGGQDGHEPHRLGLSGDPDKVVSDAPGFCPKCGGGLDDAERVLEYTTQVISIPELKPVITEVRHYAVICRKCGERVAATPRPRSNEVVYDASVKSLVVYMSVVLFLPYGRIARFLREAFGLNPSEGSLSSWVAKAKEAAQPAIERIKELIKSSAVVGFDESGCFCGKELDWAWIAQTVYYTLLFRADGRGSKELEARFGNSTGRMTAVTDRHSAYFAVNFLNHQVCLAHLLREAQYLTELDEGQDWSARLSTLLREAIHERNSKPGDVIDKAPWLSRLDGLILDGMGRMNAKIETFRRGLIKCRDYIFNFLEDPAIPPDNNASERGIRKLKIKLKNSGTFRTGDGADAFLELHSIVETAKKHGNSPFTAIRALFEDSDPFRVATAE